MKNTGDGRRVARMEKEVLQTVAGYLISGFQSATPGMVTVTSVRMPADLRTAKVYVSILCPSGTDEKKVTEALLEELQEAAPDFQSELARQLKTRYCPKITFYKDQSSENVLRVERILYELEQEKRSKKSQSTTVLENPSEENE